MILAAASAGYLNAPLAYSAPVAAVHASPYYAAQAVHAVHAAPVAVKTAVPIATSYANTYKVSSPRTSKLVATACL